MDITPANTRIVKTNLDVPMVAFFSVALLGNN